MPPTTDTITLYRVHLPYRYKGEEEPAIMVELQVKETPKLYVVEDRSQPHADVRRYRTRIKKDESGPDGSNGWCLTKEDAIRWAHDRHARNLAGNLARVQEERRDLRKVQALARDLDLPCPQAPGIADFSFLLVMTCPETETLIHDALEAMEEANRRMQAAILAARGAQGMIAGTWTIRSPETGSGPAWPVVQVDDLEPDRLTLDPQGGPDGGPVWLHEA